MISNSGFIVFFSNREGLWGKFCHIGEKLYFCFMKCRLITLVTVSVCCLLSAVARAQWTEGALHECPQTAMAWAFLPGDTVAAYSLGALEFEIHYPDRPYAEEHFPDTAYKERLVVCGQTYMIDSLLFNNYHEYSGVYFFSDDAYVIEKDYYIVSFINAFQMGTMAQPCYLVFKTTDGKACPCALYMLTDLEDNSGRKENTIRYTIEDGILYLQGENLELVRRF